MAREPIALQQKRIDSDAQQAARNDEAFGVERAALERLRDFSAQTPGEKAAQTAAQSRDLVAAHEGAQKAGRAPAANKAAQPVAQNKSTAAADMAAEEADDDDLDVVPLTSAARRRAKEAGLKVSDFKRKKKSGADGEFTVDDVERIAESK